MLAEERFREIQKYVESHGTVTVQELTDLLNTSESTVRRDLTELHKRGTLIKVHGGATTVGTSVRTRDEELSVRRDRNTEEKHKIAVYAAELIEADDFVYLDAGSSVDLLIDELNEESAVFVTNAIGHAQKLLKKGYEVLLIGGKLKGVTEAIVGAEALESLNRYNFTKGIFLERMEFTHRGGLPHQTVRKRWSKKSDGAVCTVLCTGRFKQNRSGNINYIF